MSNQDSAMRERWEAMASDAHPEPLPGVTPYLVVGDGPAAVDFYTRAFGAAEGQRMVADDGKRILNTLLRINGGAIMLSDDFPEYRGGAAANTPAGVTLHLQVDDADRWFERATAAGAITAMPLADAFWGDRYGQIRDPFGHTWSIGAAINKGEKA